MNGNEEKSPLTPHCIFSDPCQDCVSNYEWKTVGFTRSVSIRRWNLRPIQKGSNGVPDRWHSLVKLNCLNTRSCVFPNFVVLFVLSEKRNSVRKGEQFLVF